MSILSHFGLELPRKDRPFFGIFRTKMAKKCVFGSKALPVGLDWSCGAAALLCWPHFLHKMKKNEKERKEEKSERGKGIEK